MVNKIVIIVATVVLLCTPFATATLYNIAPGVGTTHYVSRTPFGSLAGFKADLLYPLFLVSFFVLGVLVVLTLLRSLLSLSIGVKSVNSRSDVAKDRSDATTTSTPPHERERRGLPTEGPGPGSLVLDRVTEVVMSAFHSQECLQRMLCELGGVIRSDKTDKMLTKLQKYMATSTAIKLGYLKDGHCGRYRCGDLPNSD